MANKIQQWLDGPYDDKTKEEIRTLQQTNPSALHDAFYRDLSFGTGGMRGLMGVGTNRMNIYTVRAATQGLASYLLRHAGEERLSVFIGFDVRHHSKLFAEEAARTLAGNGIEALITQEVCPTPLASFGCRFYGCSAAIMITASHNPPEYNGYKVYGYDGAQVVPPSDEEIIAEVRRVHTPDQIQLAESSDPLIRRIGDEIDAEYLKELGKLRIDQETHSLQIGYTNLHGTGLRLVPKALESWGFASPWLVEEQSCLNSSFPCAPSPNPEEEGALSSGMKLLLEKKADILLATDPDADRIGLAVRHKDQTVRLNGHEIACVCFNYLAESLSKRDEIPDNAAIVKTIVTTDLLRSIAESYNIHCVDVLTGFKYIAAELREWEESFGGYQFLFGAEESHGYLFNPFVRDKDAISASCLIACAAQQEKQRGRTLVDALHDLYHKFGVHRQKLFNLQFSDSEAGLEEMRAFMQRLRNAPPNVIEGKQVVRLDDYLRQVSWRGGGTKTLFLPSSNVLLFVLEDNTQIVIRPSGTEPKIKIYLEVRDLTGGGISSCDARLQKTLDAIRKL